jgi:bifunctional DNase/RNase
MSIQSFHIHCSKLLSQTTTVEVILFAQKTIIPIFCNNDVFDKTMLVEK